MLFQVRIRECGGQGAVSAAEMLSVAAFLEGKHAQAIPSFGSERMGPPVTGFWRIDDMHRIKTCLKSRTAQPGSFFLFCRDSRYRIILSDKHAHSHSSR